MAAIKAANTKPEIYVRKVLFSAGFRYRLHRKDLPGKPDLVLAKYKTVIFIHGCFWHGHSCYLGSTPKTNAEFWNNKLTKNEERDRKNIYSLIGIGWKVIIVWECAVKGKYKISAEELAKKLRDSIKDNTESLIEIFSQ